MRTSNPVLLRLGSSSSGQRYARSDYGGAGSGVYQYPGVRSDAADVMTVNDVVVKTVGLLGATVASAAATFAMVPTSLLGVAWISGAVVGLIVGLIISLAQLTHPALMFFYAVVEGVFLGAVSKFFESLYNGIIVQAVVATLGTFLVMAALYRARVVRATPRFMRVVIGAALGLFVVMLVDIVVTVATDSLTVLRDGGVVAIGFSLVCITVAALMFVVNFQQIEDGVALGLPRRYGWLGAFGMLVELVWIYIEFLRLISYFRS